jgi:hypothetical protein
MTRFALILLFTLTAAIPARAADALRFQSAFADRDITHSLGMEQPGGYGKALHQKLHDPCKVRAAVFDDGTTRVAIVSVDALLVRRALVEGARRRIHDACGIKPGAILIHASTTRATSSCGGWRTKSHRTPTSTTCGTSKTRS